MNTWVQVIEIILIYRSKRAFTSAANSSKLAPKQATKPLMQMRGFFVSRMCRKLAFVNRRGAKKPNKHCLFV